MVGIMEKPVAVVKRELAEPIDYHNVHPEPPPSC